jgi:hypothetical protein
MIKRITSSTRINLAFITKIEDGGSTGDKLPEQTMTLAYRAVCLTGRSQEATGKIKSTVQQGWNQINNIDQVDRFANIGR